MKKIFALATIAALGATSVSAATVDITSIVGTWENVTGNTNVEGEGTSQIDFGAGSTARSSYIFTSAGTATDVSSPFDIGTFTHENYVITLPSITGADLRVTVEGTVDSVAFSMGGVFRFAHTETPNSPLWWNCAEQPTVTRCDDKVEFMGATELFGDPIELDGKTVKFALEGFESGTKFLTKEGSSNTAQLRASFTTTPKEFNDPEPVPLPAAGLLLLGALGGLRLVQRKKKST